MLTLLGYKCVSKKDTKREHCWVYYIGDEARVCIDCLKQERLWADFGMVKRTADNE